MGKDKINLYNIYKLDIELLLSSFTYAYGKQECILNMPHLEEAASNSAQYRLTNRTADNMAFRQALIMLGINNSQFNADSLLEYIVYVAFNTLNNALGAADGAVSQAAKELRRRGGMPFTPEQTIKTAEQFIFENGFSIDYGGGRIFKYKRFEKSGSMSRACVLSFVRDEFAEKLTERIILLNRGSFNYDKLCKWNARDHIRAFRGARSREDTSIGDRPPL